MYDSLNKDISLSIDGIGIVIYSKGMMSYVEEGTDFFSNDFAEPESVANHIRKGDITGFCTGTSGDFVLKIREGYPDAEIDKQYPVGIRLALEVKEHTVSFMDLAWLMEWNTDIPSEQQLNLDDGFYHLTVLTRKPDDGLWGSNQTIYIYFNRLDSMPALTWKGVPQLFTD